MPPLILLVFTLISVYSAICVYSFIIFEGGTVSLLLLIHLTDGLVFLTITQRLTSMRRRLQQWRRGPCDDLLHAGALLILFPKLFLPTKKKLHLPQMSGLTQYAIRESALLEVAS